MSGTFLKSAEALIHVQTFDKRLKESPVYQTNTNAELTTEENGIQHVDVVDAITVGTYRNVNGYKIRNR